MSILPLRIICSPGVGLMDSQVQLALAVVLPIFAVIIALPVILILCRVRHRRRMEELNVHERILDYSNGDGLRAEHVGDSTLQVEQILEFKFRL